MTNSSATRPPATMTMEIQSAAGGGLPSFMAVSRAAANGKVVGIAFCRFAYPCTRLDLIDRRLDLIDMIEML